MMVIVHQQLSPSLFLMLYNYHICELSHQSQDDDGHVAQWQGA